MANPVRDRDYPSSLAELRVWFPDDRACLDYLDWLRWGQGFVCPHCSSTRSWILADGRRSCGGCTRRVSPTAGTIFHHTRTPLTVWFEAAWRVSGERNGVSALALQRLVGLGSYQTAWTMLHRLRTAAIRPNRDRLSGEVEVDETVVGGPRPGPRGHGALGKTIVAVAVERYPGTRRIAALGRCRLAVIPNKRGPTLRAFLLANVEPGATVVTDALPGYPSATKGLYPHVVHNLTGTGAVAHKVLPGVHRVASLLKRWLLGTHQGGVKPEHLGAYLDEFAFRFNRRRSDARGLLFYRLLEQGVQAPPRTYTSLVAKPGRPKLITPTAPTSRKAPRSLVRPAVARPWRGAHSQSVP